MIRLYEQTEVRLMLNTKNLEVTDQQEESGKFKLAWHHAAVARGAAARLVAMEAVE
jgi:hypothetical protein